MDNGSLTTENESILESNYSKQNDIFNPYGFEMQKIFCNSQGLQNSIDGNSEKTADVVNIFGIRWNRISDTLSTKPIDMNVEANTKRQILQTIASHFE